MVQLCIDNDSLTPTPQPLSPRNEWTKETEKTMNAWEIGVVASVVIAGGALVYAYGTDAGRAQWRKVLAQIVVVLLEEIMALVDKAEPQIPGEPGVAPLSWSQARIRVAPSATLLGVGVPAAKIEQRWGIVLRSIAPDLADRQD